MKARKIQERQSNGCGLISPRSLRTCRFLGGPHYWRRVLDRWPCRWIHPGWWAICTNFLCVGLAGDNALKWEVVTPDGKQLTVSKTENLNLYSTTYFPTYLGHFSTYFGPLPDGIYIIGQLLGRRLIPHKVVEQKEGLTSVMRSIVEDGTFYIRLSLLMSITLS